MDKQVLGGWIIVFVTTSDKEEAENIARSLLEERIAACVNIVDNVSSIYWWKEAIESSREALIIIKTRVEKFNKLVETVKKKHSYEVPEIIALPIYIGYSKYLEWIDSEIVRGEK